jgi:type IV pilus assembly protein PilA
MNKAFTLVELLVVIAIIGILSAVGIVAYNNYSLEAKKKATIANWRTVIAFIENTFAQCKLKGPSATIQLTINAAPISCNTTLSSAASVNTMADTFKIYLLEKGFTNPYNKTDPAVIRTGSGGETVDGRLRLDETTCTNNRLGHEMTVWYKVHDNTGVIARMKMHHWCQ